MSGREPESGATPCTALRPRFVPGERARRRWTEPLVYVVLAIVTALVYAPSLRGGFVFDDHHQIVRNPLIQTPGREREALMSDVWAFRGDGEESRSSYWRPAFVGWMIVHHRLLGVEATAERTSAPGWRTSTLALHVVCVMLCHAFARRLGLGLIAASGCAAAFALHTTGAESVAWISGAPSMLVTIGLLGSWLCITPRGGRRGALRWTAALALYALALGSKELAALFPAVVFVSELSRESDAVGRGAGALRRAVRVCLPFVALAAAYLAARHAVIGGLQKQTPGGVGVVEGLLTTPAAALFYAREALWPAGVSPAHALSAVAPPNVGWTTVWGPLLGVACLLGGAVWLSVRSGAARVGLALSAIALAPAFNFTAFVPEDLVHDRYLYPALPGLAVAVGVLLVWVARRVGATRAPLIAGIALWIGAGAMAPGTLAYAQAWTNDRSLWEWAARRQPDSALVLARLGVFVADAGELERALELLERSISLRRTRLAETARAGVLMRLGREQDAERALRQALDAYGADFRLYERLCALLDRQGRAAELEAAARAARDAVPGQAALFSERLASALLRQGRAGEALDELESARAAATAALDAPSKLVFLRLGTLYAQLGRAREAREAFGLYLAQTESFSDPITRRARADVEARLAKLP